jgi:hypothetical protein
VSLLDLYVKEYESVSIEAEDHFDNYPILSGIALSNGRTRKEKMLFHYKN